MKLNPMKADPGVMPAAYANNVFLTCNGEDGMLRLTFVEVIAGGHVAVASIQMTSDKALDVASQIQTVISNSRKQMLGRAKP